jgi:hypothetical protein
VQTGLLVSKRKWCDFISYSAGLPMDVIQAEAVPEIQEAIVEAARAFEAQLRGRHRAYHAAVRKRGLTRPNAGSNGRSSDMTDLAKTIAPKSDQLNADDLIAARSPSP